MNDWEKRFQEHQLHQLMSEIKGLHKGGKLTTDDPAVLGPYQRLISVLTHIEDTLDSLEPNLLVNVSPLDQMVNPATQVRNFLQAFYKDNSPGPLTNANSQADQLLNFLNNPILSCGQLQPKSLSRAAKEFASATGEIVENLRAKRDALSKQFDEFARNISKHENRLAEHEKAIDSQKNRIDNIVSQFQEQFSQAEERRRVEFEKTASERTNVFNSFKESVESQLVQFFAKGEQEHSELRIALDDQAKNIIAVLNEKKKQASDLVNVIGNIGTTGQYDNHALSDRRSADRWRLVAIAFMFALVAAAVLTVTLAYRTQQADWRMTLVRAFTTVTFAIPAFYAARESQKHRRMEHRYRKMQLELASLDPFLEKLPEEKRHALKAELTEKFFGQPEPLEKEEEPVTAVTLFGLLKMVLQNLTKK